jgi:hypothetical protein
MGKQDLLTLAFQATRSLLCPTPEERAAHENARDIQRVTHQLECALKGYKENFDYDYSHFATAMGGMGFVHLPTPKKIQLSFDEQNEAIDNHSQVLLSLGLSAQQIEDIKDRVLRPHAERVAYEYM